MALVRIPAVKFGDTIRPVCLPSPAQEYEQREVSDVSQYLKGEGYGYKKRNRRKVIDPKHIKSLHNGHDKSSYERGKVAYSLRVGARVSTEDSSS